MVAAQDQDDMDKWQKFVNQLLHSDLSNSSPHENHHILAAPVGIRFKIIRVVWYQKFIIGLDLTLILL